MPPAQGPQSMQTPRVIGRRRASRAAQRARIALAGVERFTRNAFHFCTAFFVAFSRRSLPMHFVAQLPPIAAARHRALVLRPGVRGATPAAVKQRAWRALRRLRDVLEPQ